jgi:hypothetical protein
MNRVFLGGLSTLNTIQINDLAAGGRQISRVDVPHLLRFSKSALFDLSLAVLS